MATESIEIDRLDASDPVEMWKRSALAQIAAVERPRAKLELRVSAGILGLTALAGAARGPRSALFSAAITLSALLVHELARAGLVRAWGRSSRACLSAFSVETVCDGPPLRGLRALAFAVAGSVGNGALAVCAFLLGRAGAFAQWSPLWRGLVLAHTAWAVLALLPLLPFQAGRALARRLAPVQRLAYASFSGFLIVTLGSLAVQLANRSPIAEGLWLVAMANAGKLFWDARADAYDVVLGTARAIQKIDAQIVRGECDAAATAVRKALPGAHSLDARRSLNMALAWAGIGKRDAFLTHTALLQLPAGAIDVHLLAAYLACCGRNREACLLLEQARGRGQRSTATSRLLIDLLLHEDRTGAARLISEQDRDLLSEAERAAVAEALCAREPGT